MFNSLIIAVGGIIVLMVIWIGVQQLWRRVFAAYISDPDVLSERSTCGNCTCTTACTKKNIN